MNSTICQFNKIPADLYPEIQQFLTKKEQTLFQSLSLDFLNILRNQSFWNRTAFSKTVFAMHHLYLKKCICDPSQEKTYKIIRLIVSKTKNKLNLCKLISERWHQSIKPVPGRPFMASYMDPLDPSKENGILREPISLMEEERAIVKDFEENHCNASGFFFCALCDAPPPIEEID